MAINTAYPRRQDWRRPYHGAKAVDGACRNHGSCPYCAGNREHATRQREDEALDGLVAGATDDQIVQAAAA
jgi:hypothetical protein